MPGRINTWAIPLNDSDYRKWFETPYGSQIQFNWNVLPLEQKPTQARLQIAVAKQNKSLAADDIITIAKGLGKFRNAKPNDVVIGVSGKNTIQQVGIINEIQPGDFFGFPKSLSVQWKVKKLNEDVSAVFIPDAPVQLIDKHAIKNFPATVRRHMPESAYETVEYIYNYETLEVPDPKEDTGGIVSVFFGTNRTKSGYEDLNEYFTDQAGDMIYGRCKVSIPRGHIEGAIERPKRFLGIQLRKENIGKDVMLTDIAEMTEKGLLALIARDIGNSEKNAALIFIHGYNMTFAEAAWETAQIHYDVPFKGVSGFFSWPSSGTYTAYLKDIEMARASVPLLANFVEKIVTETNAEELHLIAHSMGNVVMAEALQLIKGRPNAEAILGKVKQIILAAPDIDQGVFKSTILPAFKLMGARRTLYSSDQDKALKLSTFLRLGLPRLGFGEPNLFVEEGIDTVDSSNVPSEGNHHSYVFQTKEVLSDLYNVLHFGRSPDDRRLKSRIKNKLPYWLFPK